MESPKTLEEQKRVESITERRLSRWAPTILTFIIWLVGIAYMYGAFEQRLRVVEKHSQNNQIHMPFETKAQHFVLRGEFENMRKGFQEAKLVEAARMERIEAKLDRVYEILISTAQKDAGR